MSASFASRPAGRARRTKAAARAAAFVSSLAIALAALVLVAPHAAVAAPRERTLHAFGSIAIAPDGKRVAAIESDEARIDGTAVRQHLIVRAIGNDAAHEVMLPCEPSTECVPSYPTWSPDGKQLVFVLKSPKSKRHFLYTVTPDAFLPKKILAFSGTLVSPRFSHSGVLAVLATPNARKEVGATQAGAPIVGEIGVDEDEQRIGVVSARGVMHFASPGDLYVYEYDWMPDGMSFVGTAAHGNGDNNWWIAKLYAFDGTNVTARVLYTPTDAKQQIADPRVSPNGHYVAFIGGIMSDFGSTGGDLFEMPARGGAATNVTPGAPRSVVSIAWDCRTDATRPITLRATTLHAGETAVETYAIDASTGADRDRGRSIAPDAMLPTTLWHGAQSIDAGDGAFASACGSDMTAVVRQDFERPPEIAVGKLGEWHDLTHANAGIAPAVRATSVMWKSDAFDGVQGWLLAPRDLDPAKKYPMIVAVHGGPSAASDPRFVGNGTTRDYIRDGYFVFYPNPRGSFGNGEAFAQANVRDFGYGDLRDILAGVDAVEKRAPIDDARLGITGGSYGRGAFELAIILRRERHR
jgi:dipeptidyl aminopeptidase/acylaminoacyl peptidase